MVANITCEQCLSRLPAETFFLTRYKTGPLATCLDAHVYRVVARRLRAEKEASVLARLSLRLGRLNDGVPVVRLSGRTLVSFEILDRLDTGDPSMSIEYVGPDVVNTASPEGRKALVRLVRGYIKRRAARRGFVVGVADFILSPRFRMVDARESMGLQTGVVFSVSLDGANRLVLDCDMRSKILSQTPLSERVTEDGFDVGGMQVSGLRTAETMIAEELLDRPVGRRDPKLGMSILEYNRQNGRYPEGFDPDPACPVIRCRVEGASRRYDYDSQLLFEVLDLKRVRRLDKDFASRIADAMRMDTVERERFCTYFVRQIRGDVPRWLDFDPRAEVVGKGNDYQAFDVALPPENLLFAGGRRASTVEKGITEYGLFKPPGMVSLAVLIPAGHERASQNRVERLCRELTGLCRDGVTGFDPVFSEVYEPRNPFRIRAAVEAASVSGAEIVLVILPGRNERSPYGMLKSELARKRLPSQMVHLDTHLSRRELVNILVGLTSKTGRAENWRIGTMLWPPDLFIGVACAGRDDETMAAVATAFDSTGRALDVTVETFGGRSEVIPESRLLHLLEGALLAYRSLHGDLPASVVVHRDGRFEEERYRRVWTHFKELGTAMTLVAVDLELPPRVGRLKRDRREAPAPGTMILTSEDEGLVITSSPRGGRGSPRPIGFRRCSGLMDTRAIGSQLFWLSRAHTGSITPPRLPVTVHFARRVLEMVCDGLVPQGTMGSKMLFV